MGSDFNPSANQRKFLRQHLVLLQPLSANNPHFSLNHYTGGYRDVMQTIADLVRVSMLALENSNSGNLPNVPEPLANISGVLALILDMLPYEEAELLDILHKSCLEGQGGGEFCEDSIFLLPPEGL